MQLIKKPKLIQLLRDNLVYGVDEYDLDAACDAVAETTRPETGCVKYLWAIKVHSFMVPRAVVDAVVEHLGASKLLAPVSYTSDVDVDGNSFEPELIE